MTTKRKSTKKKKPAKRKTAKRRAPKRKSDSALSREINRDMGKLLLCTVCNKHYPTKRTLRTHKHKENSQ